jgi:hypothetical protein
MRMVSSFAGPGPSGPVTPFFREEEGVKHNISCFVRDYGRLRLVPLGGGRKGLACDVRVVCAPASYGRPGSCFTAPVVDGLYRTTGVVHGVGVGIRSWRVCRWVWESGLGGFVDGCGNQVLEGLKRSLSLARASALAPWAWRGRVGPLRRVRETRRRSDST